MKQEPDAHSGSFGVVAAAAYLDVSRTTLYRLINSGDLRIVKVRSRTLIPRSELDTYLARHAHTVAS